MKFSQRLSVIDSHNAGEPMRLVTGGVPFLKGKSMAEKQDEFRKKHDYLRKTVMHEPRGHSDMFGGLLCEPVDDQADLGVIFFDAGNYYHMCGHGAMAVARVAVDTGLKEKKEPVTEVVLDTSAGIVCLKVMVEDGEVQSVRMLSNPAFHYKEDIEINLTEFGKIELDVAFGGNFFALVDVNQFNLKISQEQVNFFLKQGMRIINEVNRKVLIKHPVADHINEVTDIMFYELLDENVGKNVVVLGKGQFDRSPCGTGTTSRLAMMYSKGEIAEKEKFVHRSIIDSEFTAWVEKELKIGEFDGVQIAIESTPWITGFSDLVVSEDDRYKHGFLINQF